MRAEPANQWNYDQSVFLGHPGRLAASYCGLKALSGKLSSGAHVLQMDTTLFGKPASATYAITAS